MSCPAVAERYVQSFERALIEYDQRHVPVAQPPASRPASLPEMDLRHVRAMTDDTGLLQHAAYSIPRYDDGYCLDDNARGLLLMALVADGGSADDPVLVGTLSSRYL